MRTQQLLSLLFTLLSLKSFSQQKSSEWQWLNPKPSGFSNNKVFFSNQTHGFIFNDNGELIHTTDGGAHWAIQQRFTNAKVMDIFDSTGIIAGFSNEIYLSTDNGTNWQRKVVSTEQNPYFKFVQVISRDTLLALNSNNSTLYKSTDRGITWTTVITNTFLNNNLFFCFVNSKIGFIGGYGGIQKTVDGGITWQPVYIYNSWGILTIRFFNEIVGFAFREDGKLLKTTDGGLTWISSDFSFDLHSLFFINQTTIYAAGEQAKIYKTTDGGSHWNVISPPSPNFGFTFRSIYFMDENKGFVVGTSGKILSTTDGGLTWNQYSVTHTEITSFYLPSNHVIYATDWWSVYKSSDKGQTWQSNLSLINQNSRFTHSWFRNKDTGFVVSRNPVRFYKTYNGGQTWFPDNPLPADYEYVLAMDFVNDSTGYLCMYNAAWACQLFKTTNGGRTWDYIGVSYNVFQQLDFISAKTGYASIAHKIFMTTDSAKTWQVVFNTDYDWITGIHFVNSSVGYCFGYNGFMKKTIDGGSTWSKVYLPSYGHIKNAHFFNEQVGYILSETYDGILKTYDGGNTWHHESNVAPAHITSTSDTTVYVAGNGGAILSQPIQGYILDSILVKNITSCSADFSTYISVAFGNVSNIRLEYGLTGFDNVLDLTPSSVTDNTSKFNQHLQNLTQGTVYRYRLRFLYKGNQIHSDEGSFETLSLPRPTIVIINDTLISSSYSSNQWFLNGQPIMGATERFFKPTGSGSYSVQVSELNCLSQISDAINIEMSAPDLEKQTSVSPNPARDNVYIKNQTGNTLAITIKNLYGNVLYSTRSNNAIVTIPIKHFAAGLYLITINEIGTNKSITRKILKQ